VPTDRHNRSGAARASHIIPWSDCNDERRLDVHNGLLLSALWDAAFDQGLVSFADDGTPLFGPKLSETARKTLGAGAISPLRGLRASHRRTPQRIVRGVVSRTEMARETKSIRWTRGALLHALKQLPERASARSIYIRFMGASPRKMGLEK
jgi:hypothetical protein